MLCILQSRQVYFKNLVYYNLQTLKNNKNNLAYSLVFLTPGKPLAQFMKYHWHIYEIFRIIHLHVVAINLQQRIANNDHKRP